METNWGIIVKKLREERHLSQEELADKSGIGRPHLSHIELGKIKDAKTNVLNKLAKGLNMSISDLVKIVFDLDFPEDNRLPAPETRYIYSEFPVHAGQPAQPVDQYYRSGFKPAGKNIEGYVVRGNCLEPVVSEGDIIIIDRDGQIDNGDLVACLIEGELHIAKLRKVAGELWLENNFKKYRFQECLVSAPIIEVIKRLKGLK